MIQFFKKSFEQWFEVKPKIHNKQKFPRFLKSGDIFWYHCGENVGTEICGKGEEFFRPCIIYTVLSVHNIVIIPLSTKMKEGDWYVPIFSSGKKAVACFQHITSIDTRRLDTKIGELSNEERVQIQERFDNLYCKKIDPQGATKGDPTVLEEQRE